MSSYNSIIKVILIIWNVNAPIELLGSIFVRIAILSCESHETLQYSSLISIRDNFVSQTTKLVNFIQRIDPLVGSLSVFNGEARILVHQGKIKKQYLKNNNKHY